MDVLIVEPLDGKVLQWLAARHTVRYAPELASDPQSLRKALTTVRAVVIPPSVTIDAQTLQGAPAMLVVGRLSSGSENIDIDACARRGIEVVRPATASAVAEAEFTIGALLQMLRRVPIANDEGLLVGRELGSAVVGLVGMTSTAKPLAQLLRAFGARVVGYDPGLHASDPVWERTGVEPMGLSELMQNSDAVCVLLGYFARFAGLFGERLLDECKANQVLVSLGHSSLFDETALAWALLSGQMSAAWFDSLEPGLLDPGRPLCRIDTLQVTPRVAGTTQQSRTRSAWAVARRIDELLFAVPAPVVLKSALQSDDYAGLAGDPVPA